ncbi:MAG: SMP-30/gluconolactonase/LRE family protein [Actinomycetota bacterium]|nr:SMP-30/gluconolactonase/LRE family protein [Actinomycetota bacterium]
MPIEAQLLDDAGATVGEGPVWDQAEGALVWVDILAGKVHLSEADGRRRRSFDVGTHVGDALPAEGGGWLLVTSDGFSQLRADGTLTVLLDVHSADPHLRFNDACCDPAGRAFAGTMRYDEGPGEATLYRLDGEPTGWRAVALIEGVGLCNGIGWSPEGTTMYFVDTLSRQVDAHPYDPETAQMGPARPLCEIDASDGSPDGLCVDSEGGVWVALYGGGQVRRYLPDGRLDEVVRLPVSKVTCPAFGGEHLNRLYVTSARAEGEPGSGGLWAAAPGVSGLPATPWRPGGASQ